MKRILLLALIIATSQLFAQENYNYNKFKQLKEELATPTVYRTASGAPGHEYYQQKESYNIDVTIDDEKQSISGKETITYKNNSPDKLEYLWIQLDQNVRAKDSDTKLIKTSRGSSSSFGKNVNFK
ncbi:MAG: M1 family peptidase, partial [Vicingaceae bacterium]